VIKNIDEVLCTGCGLCEDVCPTDIFRRKDNRMHIAYPADCCHCLQCLMVCPVDAVTFVPGVPKKFDSGQRWKQMKAALTGE
jgi:ferredoxin